MTSDRVRMSFSFAMTEPYNISLTNPEMAGSLKLVATVRQESSPFPDRAVTLLTTKSILDNGSRDAFARGRLDPPTDVNDEEVKIYMHRFGVRCMRPARDGGAYDMRQREEYNFITVPPVGQGSIDIVWPFAPDVLLRSYYKEGDLKERLRKFTVGQEFKIQGFQPRAIWWTWGSLEHDLKNKRFSRWSFPNSLSIVREAGEDEGDIVDSSLIGVVDPRDLGSVIYEWNRSGTRRPNAEQPPNVKEMRIGGWIFGEPPLGLELTCDQAATFRFVE